MQIHGKEITTIISDLDGTLLGEKKELEPAVFSLIRAFEKRGVRFVAASGRQYKNMRLLFEPVRDDMLFICENGSLVVKREETVYVKCIPRELAFALLEDLFAIPGTETIISSDRELYTLSSRKAFIRMINAALKPEISTVEDYHMIQGGFNKMSIWWQGEIPEKEARLLHEKYDDRLQVADGGNGWLDFTMKGVNKGVALRELAKQEGIPLEETLCFGDNENDLELFHECAVSYAMETSKEKVKVQADHVCGNVVKILQSFLEENIS